MVQIVDKKVLSSDGVHQLVGKVYIPEGDIKGLFQVVHGMIEHIERYHDFMQEVAENGYIVFAYDQLGHGHTAVDRSELGFIAHENGWKHLVDDVNRFAEEVREEYGSQLPYYLMGHSMGSFIVRLTAEKFDMNDKLIIMGTSGPNPAAQPGIAAIKLVKKTKGERYYSKFLENLAFGTYNKKFGNDDPLNWISSIKEERDKYRNDPLHDFHFTASAMEDLINLIHECNTNRWFSSRVTKKPILLISGANDPVGNYGKGVKAVHDKLKANGADVKFKLYANARHEILNDICAKKVKKDILEFIAKEYRKH